MQLQILSDLLQQNATHVIKFLQTGIGEESINEKARLINVSFPPELFELYKWANGTKWAEVKLIDLWITPGIMFFSLEKAIEAYTKRAGKDEYWKKNMFPVFGDGGGDYYLMDLDKNSKNYKQIFYYCLNETDFEVIVSHFDSLEAAINTIIEWYLQKAFVFQYEQTPNFISNYKLLGKIGRELNPKSEYWKLYE